MDTENTPERAPRTRRSQLVYTGVGGNVFTATPETKHVQQLTWSWDEGAVRHTEEAASAHLTHVWPVWASDGTRIACFGLRGDDEAPSQTSLFAVAADGVESWALADLAGGMPIYGNWSPRGDRFAALIQRKQQLSLEMIALSQPGKSTLFLSGAPLFWSWAPDGHHLAAHVGATTLTPARVVILDTATGAVVNEVSNRPGDFRVPAWSPQGDLLAYVEQTEGANTLFLLDVKTGEKGPVTISDKTIVAVWSPDGNALAFATAARPGSLAFPLVKVLDLSTGRITPVINDPVTGFFWSPPGDALFYLSIDTQHNYFQWHRVAIATGKKIALARFLPTREQTFVFSFFDQYALSHPPLSPDGNTLTFAGHLLDAGVLRTPPLAQVYVLRAEDGATPHTVSPGQFVSWNLA